MSDDATISYKGSLKTHIWVLMLKSIKSCCQSPAAPLLLSSRVLSVVGDYLLLRLLAPLLHLWDWLKDIYIAYQIGELVLNGESESSNFAWCIFIIVVISLVVDALAMPLVLFLHPTDRPFMRWSPADMSAGLVRGLWRFILSFMSVIPKDVIPEENARRQASRYARKNWSFVTFLRSMVRRFFINVYDINANLMSINMLKEQAEQWARGTSLLDSDEVNKVRLTRTTESLMAKLRETEHRLRSRLAYLKMTTNIVEDFIQLALLVILICLWHTSTGSITDGVVVSDLLFEQWGKHFLIPNFEYVFASTSLMSLILGHMSLLSTNKNGFTAFIGRWFIALPYFIIGTAGRIVAVVLFFTPIIGLFDTMYPVQMGKIPDSSDKQTNAIIGTKYTGETLNETWSNFAIAENSEFPGIPFWVGFTPAVLMVIHIVVGYIILRVVLGDYEGEWDDLPLLKCDFVVEESGGQDVEGNVAEEEHQEKTPKTFKYGRRALYSLWTMVCPPLFLDWEEILRHYTDSDIFDKKPWERELPKNLGKIYILIILNGKLYTQSTPHSKGMLVEANQNCFCLHRPQQHREPHTLHPALLPEVLHRPAQQRNVANLLAPARGRDLDTKGRSIGTTDGTMIISFNHD